MLVGTSGRTMLVLALCASGCIGDSLVPCGELSCPVGNVCTPGGCAEPADVTACEGLAEGAACRASNGGIGTCEGGACHTGLCGNGVVDVGEVCDDGNQTSGDGCRGDCKKLEVCGDGELDQGEACDDGNHNPADGCDACKLTAWQVTVAVGSAIAATSTPLALPSGVAFDGSGRIFVADTDNHRVVRIETDGSLTTIAGTGVPGFSGDGGAATSAQLDLPSAVAVDGLGRVFVSDSANARIRRIDTDGTIQTIAGTGTVGFGGDGNPAIFAQLANPHGIAVDGFGRVFFADSDNNRVRRIDIDGTITTIAGDGTADYGGDGGDATLAWVQSPLGVAIDPAGRVVIADTYNNRVRRIALDGTIATIAGDGNFGFLGDGGPAAGSELAFPVGVVVDAAGDVVIADTENQRVRVIDTGGTITTIAGTGDTGFTGDGGPALAAELADPVGVAVDANGRVAIADTFNQRVRVIDTAGNVATVAGTGAFGLGSDGDAATSAILSNPFGVAIDPQGRIYIAATFDQRVRRVELDGTITTVAGDGISFYAGDGGPATEAELDRPDAVALDAQGRLYICDTFNDRVRRVELDGTISTIAGNGVQGFSGDGGQATAAELAHPNAIAIDAQGRVLVADTYNHRLRRIELDGTINTIAGTGAYGFGGDGGPATAATLSFPYAVVTDAQGRIVFGDTSNNRVRRIALDGTIDTIAGTGTAGFSGDGGPAVAAELSSPYGIAIDPQGRLVVVDDVNQRIRRIATDGTITTVAGTGVAGADGDAASALSAQLAFPIAVAIDPQGGIVFTDTNNQRIRRVDATTGVISTVAGKVDPGSLGPTAHARLVDPQAIAVSPSLEVVAGGTSGTLLAVGGGKVVAVAGRYPQATPTGALARYRTDSFGSIGGAVIDPSTGLVYISETSANRLHVITPVDPAKPDTWTIAVLANSAGATGSADGDALAAQFNAPTGLYLDAASHVLYIADTGNHAIRALDLTTHAVTTIVNTSHSLGFAGDGGPAAAALLYQPSGVVRCANGDLFVADTGNNRIRRVRGGTISTVLGDGVGASSGEGAPARTFPVDSPRGLGCDSFGNLFVTSRTAVRLLAADDSGVVDGSGSVHTIYGAPPRTTFPESVTSCLTGLAVTGAASVEIADACTGLLVKLDRAP